MTVFSGLKVLDAASFIAGPAAATVLADFGADVIKVEPPAGDLQRVLSSVPPSPRAHANYSWHLANHNKRGMCIDLKSPGGTTILQRLVEWADVVITNAPHGAREELHLGYEQVSAWNPRVVYADVTGFGDAGPDAKLPGFDLTAYWSRSGLLSSTRDAGAPPTVPVPGSGDYASAIGLYAAIVTAIYHRERTGKGTSVGTSLLAGGVWAAGTFVTGALAGGRSYGLHNPNAPTNPLINPYQSSDGRWFMLVASPPHWPGLAKAVGHPELPADPRFADAHAMAKHSAELTDLLDAAFRSQSLAHWQDVLDRAHITYGVIQTPEEVAADPQLRANEMVVPLDGVGELAETVSSPVTVRGLTKARATRAPELGEHNDEVLGELGFSSAEIARLRTTGVIPAATKQEAA
ncbi:CoA transferase [Solirubrobacter ginsenosidimutans]|uniref:CoA transferase n=1 Tax=Solirubrobacter ginsenosidimutans TaxID=490573 RepID=A0A9X3S0C5_9ACTN|nr:CoA transferase [Solirubrobacter ginsenosidimutans]MDA0159887.1 CoA transferase [Solirubrobacter ginsenosidimutans]